MTTTETIWANVYSAEYQRLASDWTTAQRPVPFSQAPQEVKDGYGAQAAAMADAAVASIPAASQAALAAQILALKP